MREFSRLKNMGLLFVFLLNLVLSQSACSSRDLYICASGRESCDKNCVNLKISDEHCGACGKACTNGLVCESSICKLRKGQECKSGETKECYEGVSKTKGIGLCKGSQTCSGSGKWGRCLGEVKPSLEVCNEKDDDCDGKTDEGGLCGGGRVCEEGKCVVSKYKCVRLGSCVYIRSGSFMMGSPSTESGRQKDEVLHKVSISYSYLMMKYEVIQGEYERLMGYNPSHFDKCGLNCPVGQVTWHEAAGFANAKSKQDGLEQCFRCSGSKEKMMCKAVKKGIGYLKCKGWRLPSEAEWEYAYRAGTTTAFYNGDITVPNGKDPNADKIAWYYGNSGNKRYEVGLKVGNGWGLYDMAGNMYEWVYDGYGAYGSGDVVDPLRDIGSGRVIRGGSWNNYARFVRAAFRFRNVPADRDYYVGFRLSRAPHP